MPDHPEFPDRPGRRWYNSTSRLHKRDSIQSATMLLRVMTEQFFRRQECCICRLLTEAAEKPVHNRRCMLLSELMLRMQFRKGLIFLRCPV